MVENELEREARGLTQQRELMASHYCKTVHSLYVRVIHTYSTNCIH